MIFFTTDAVYDAPFDVADDDDEDVVDEDVVDEDGVEEENDKCAEQMMGRALSGRAEEKEAAAGGEKECDELQGGTGGSECTATSSGDFELAAMSPISVPDVIRVESGWATDKRISSSIARESVEFVVAMVQNHPLWIWSDESVETN